MLTIFWELESIDTYENLRPIQLKLLTADTKICCSDHNSAILAATEYANQPIVIISKIPLQRYIFKMGLLKQKTVDCSVFTRNVDELTD